MSIAIYFKEFAKYASLNVCGMLALSCYILADTFFVSKGLGANGLAALNLAIPIYSFINGSGLMIGMGGASKYAIQKSLHEKEHADHTFTKAILLASIFALFFVALGVFFANDIVVILGADVAIYEMSYTYLQVILCFAPFFLLNNVLLCFIRNDGAPQLAMRAMIGGSLSNIILDYVFMFPMQLGIFGAVLATGLAPIISMLILSPYFIKKQHHFHIKWHHTIKQGMLTIFSNGLPSLLNEVSAGVIIIVFNIIILNLQGNIGIAAYGVIANLSLVVIAIFTGIAQGIQPLISHYYAIAQPHVVKHILRYALITMLTISIIIYTCVHLGANSIVNMFNSEQHLLLQEIAERGLKLYFLVCPFVGFNIILSIYFTSTQHAIPAHIISLLRGFLIILPMAFIMSYLAGLDGVWCVFALTEILVSGITWIFYLKWKKPV